MKITPIASESLGVRSMATYIETNDCNILIDPSAALGTKRYGLVPTPQEHKALKETKKTIAKYAQKTDIFTISHYHFDHYDLHAEFYKSKKVFAKDINKNINKSQQQRGKEFKKTIEKTCDLIFCDTTQHQFGDTKLEFSPPFYHGPENIKLGFVLMTLVDDKEKKVLHASDVQGPITQQAKNYILKQKPDLLIMDGPPTHMLGFRFSKKNLELASANLVEIITKLDCEILLDHHLLRDLKYQEHFKKPYEVGKKRVKTFAEYLGKKNNTLEANRKKLWKGEM